LLQRILPTILLTGCIILALVLHFTAEPPVSTPVSNTSVIDIARKQTTIHHAITTNQTKVNTSLPIRLTIPRIKVDAPIAAMSILSTGDLEAPAGPQTVGWFRYGAYPGDNGSAVIDGHYGRWPDGQGSVFDHLNQVRIGDKIYVSNAQGDIITFVVKSVGIYNPNSNATAVFHSSGNTSHLNLITCEGVWNKRTKKYSGRLVVFTDKV